MWVSGSKLWTCRALTSTSKEKSAMACYMMQRPASYAGSHWNVHYFYQLLLCALKFQHIFKFMCKQLQVKLFSYFNLVRNFKFTANFHSPAFVGMYECDYLLSMPKSWTSTRCVFVDAQSISG